MSNKDDTLRQFCDVTGADESRSRFFLESSNWQLEVALSSFYENEGNLDEASVAQPARASAPAMSDSDMESPPVSPQGPVKKDTKRPTNPKFATLNTLQNDSSDDEEEDLSNLSTTSILARLREIEQHATTCSSNNDSACQKYVIEMEKEIASLKKEIEQLKVINTATSNANIELKKKYDHEIAEYKQEIVKLKDALAAKGQAFYAGGSERSGQQIIGPGKGRKDIVSEMFKSVKEHGAVVFDDEPSTASRGRGAFSGVGYRLGQSSDDHEQVTPLGGSNSDSTDRAVRLCLYREGFSVDGGALRPYTDPNNAAFLDSIRRGDIPAELRSAGTKIRVSLEDRRHEPVPRDKHAATFTGKGHMLGSPTPVTVGAPAPAPPGAPAAPAASVDRSESLRAAQLQVKLDDSQPVTTVQIRLTDGSVITGRFNLSHTIGTLHEYIARAVPYYEGREFTLCSTYPRKDLTDRELTITGAGLANSTLLQRLN